MDYIEKAEAALVEAEEKVKAGESGKEWIEIAGRWKDLAALKNGDPKLPPYVSPRMPRPTTDFRWGLYL
jgi:hypothetical protein